MRLAALLFLIGVVGAAQAADRFPGATWSSAPAGSNGWSAEGVAKARAWSERVAPSAAVMIVQHGQVVAEWGDTVTKSNLHSVRKSLLSALVGIAVAEGKIDLKATIGSLGIDDNPPSLTPVEQQATVHDLLAARSGVYHPALYETPAMAAARPKRGSHPPGSFWYYNNWDFNTFGTIYERATAEGIFDAFDRLIARPIGMQDYQPSDGTYVRGGDSIHPAYPIRMSARDLARFALLYLREGRWNGRQVVPASWVSASTQPYSDTGTGSHYGYFWWLGFIELGNTPTVKLPPGSYSAQGFLGQYAFVIPPLDLVVVHRVNSDRAADAAFKSPSLREMSRLMWLILAAAGARDIGPDATLEAAAGPPLAGEQLKRLLAGASLRYTGYASDGAQEMRVRADGRMTYHRGPELAEFDAGTWSVEDDRFCRERRRPRPAKSCSSVVADGAWLRLFDANGLMELTASVTRE
jgi:CubicO group peptidase (beta-lactamase class C family)